MLQEAMQEGTFIECSYMVEEFMKWLAKNQDFIGLLCS
jgi:hypothetical protein